MKLNDILDQLNIIGQCRRYGVSLWQCPQFLFLVMGMVIIATMLTSYLLGIRYIEDPLMVAFLVILITAFLFIIGSVIVQSFEKLAEVSRMKTEFINIVSHQLRAPLTSMKWALEEFILKLPPEATHNHEEEYISILKDNNERMAKLINDLLIVARAEQGKLVIKKEEISPTELIERSIKDFSPMAQALNVQVIFERENDLPKIFADPFQLKLVIDNLLDNAIRYSRPSQDRNDGESGIVEMRLKNKGKDVYFEIKDNGVGIPDNDQKYIFQKFFRSSNASRYQTQGTGLGLFIAKSIIEALKGKIAFKSNEDDGSTFWFTLPINNL
ncbi:MAG: HAMP domain-containing histidine kinase [Candidatus Nealsonbacteria bacterium]|nr:HAMP domain-containing histidine kinase [Candidatus Nealsonbacteria bacterium]